MMMMMVMMMMMMMMMNANKMTVDSLHSIGLQSTVTRPHSFHFL